MKLKSVKRIDVACLECYANKTEWSLNCDKPKDLALLVKIFILHHNTWIKQINLLFCHVISKRTKLLKSNCYNKSKFFFSNVCTSTLNLECHLSMME